MALPPPYDFSGLPLGVAHQLLQILVERALENVAAAERETWALLTALPLDERGSAHPIQEYCAEAGLDLARALRELEEE